MAKWTKLGAAEQALSGSKRMSEEFFHAFDEASRIEFETGFVFHIRESEERVKDWRRQQMHYSDEGEMRVGVDDL